MNAIIIYIAYNLIWSAIMFPIFFIIDPQTDLTTKIVWSVIFGCIFGCTYPIMACIKPVMFGVKLKSLFTSEEDLHDKMLRYMNYVEPGGIKGALEGLNLMFMTFPEWELHEWIPFKAWYKHEIDYMCQKPDIYGMSFKGNGSPYIKEKDSLFDPDVDSKTKCNTERGTSTFPLSFWRGMPERRGRPKPPPRAEDVIGKTGDTKKRRPKSPQD